MKITYEQAIRFILNHYGVGHQTIKAIEERSELTKELCKWQNGFLNREALIDELADERVTGDQIIAFLGCEEEVNRRIEAKVQRQLVRMAKGE